jgi:hypothetical protein
LRKRRSSRTAGLTSTKESGPTTLWFRPGEDQKHALTDWARYIQSLIQPGIPNAQPTIPISPSSPTFINPFGSRNQEISDYLPQGFGKKNKKSTFETKSSGSTQVSSRDPRTMYNSDSPSLRSRRSDVSSSHASSQNTGTTGYTTQQYTSVLPSDLPSPALTGEYHDEFIEGWTSAQGRSSTLGSPIRGGRESVASSRAATALGSTSSSPPGPRETILDRAFQMRYIPGTDQDVPGEENLSSIARFDALMREAEGRRQAKERDAITIREPTRSTWEDDDSEDIDRFDDDSDDDDLGFEQDLEHDSYPTSPVHRAFDFTVNRRSSVQAPRSRHVTRNSLSYHEAQGLSASIMRPHTAHSKIRPSMAPRTSSQPQMPIAELLNTTLKPIDDNIATQRYPEHRLSQASAKRISFNDFTKRLSSSSSLLLVQTNASGSSRASSEIDPLSITPRGGLNPRGTPLSPDRERDERCRWRGSVGVFGSTEGGFL